MAGEQRLAYLRRVAIVFSADIRIKIVSELFQREMSAKQFFEQFGGGSITRVDRHFKRLAQHGWLRHVRSEGPDSQRRGSREHFFRAPELAILDNESWSLLPYSVRVATSWRTFRTLGGRVEDAAAAETLDARPEGSFSCDDVVIDEPGWVAVVGAVDSYFETMFEEQADARLRMFHSGERSMSATVALAAFESPCSDPRLSDRRSTPCLVPAPAESTMPFYRRLSKVMGDDLSLAILAEANSREISAPILTAKIGADYQWIRRRVRGLEESGWLLRVGEERRLNASELFYRATVPAFSEEEGRVVAEDSTKSVPGCDAFRRLRSAAKEAILGGTFEARVDNHLSWSGLCLDQQGWENVANGLSRLRSFLHAEHGRAQDRLSSSGGPTVAMTVGLGAFESPITGAREP